LTKAAGNTGPIYPLLKSMRNVSVYPRSTSSNAADSYFGRGLDMAQEWIELPPLPEIGRSESYYADQVKRADSLGNQHAREGYKVGQYITLGLNRRLDWEKKLRYFNHALRSHCVPPNLTNDKVWLFYAQLADLVRQHAGAEALRLASLEDDYYVGQLKAGVPRPQIMAQAQIFFRKVLGDGDKKPEHLNQEDFEQLKILRNQWI
jgi:hypothetical protein